MLLHNNKRLYLVCFGMFTFFASLTCGMPSNEKRNSEVKKHINVLQVKDDTSNPTWKDTKLALDSLDKVLENSRTLRERLRNLLSKKANTLYSGKEKKLTSKQRDTQLKENKSDKLQQQLNREITEENAPIAGDAVVKTSSKILPGKDTTSPQKLAKDNKIPKPQPVETPSIAKPPDLKRQEDGVPPPPKKVEDKFGPPEGLKDAIPPPPEEIKYKVPPEVQKQKDKNPSLPANSKNIGNKKADFVAKEKRGGELLKVPPPEKPKAIVPAPLMKKDSPTWTKWSAFSNCHLDLKGHCHKKRKRLCLADDPSLCADVDKYGIQVQIEECERKECANEGEKNCVDTDDHFECRFLAQVGKCDESPDRMWSNCCASCQDCVDKDLNCSQRASIGDCKTHKEYMEKKCPASCRICAKPELPGH